MIRSAANRALLAAAAALVAAPLGAGQGGPLVLRASKVLTCAEEGPQVIDRALLVVREGRIAAVGREGEVRVPAGAERIDCGELWLAPGIVELHSHVAGLPLFGGVDDITDGVYLANPGLRASTSVIPDNPDLRVAVAGGVTTVLYIPGSATNNNGWGVLLKTGHDRYEEMRVRDPGSLKVAQSGNPERWGFGPGRSFQNFNTRTTVRKGVAYAKAWERHENGEGEKPAVDPQWENYRDLYAKEIAVSAHTQVYQVVLKTITMFRQDFDLRVFLDHSTIGGWKTGPIAKELGVPAIVGPRAVDSVSRRFLMLTGNHDRFEGVAAGYQRGGLEEVGFNTDSPIVPQQELPLQGAMAARYGFDDSDMAVVRGLTIVPARAAGIADRVGSLEVGKEADVIVVSGHPADPRTRVELVLQDGEIVYDASKERRRW